MRVKASTKGQIVLPAGIREKYDIRPGRELELTDMGTHLCLSVAYSRPTREVRGLLKGETSLTHALVEARRRDRARER